MVGLLGIHMRNGLEQNRNKEINKYHARPWRSVPMAAQQATAQSFGSPDDPIARKSKVHKGKSQ
jgi:hypothetical protein